MHLSGEMPLLVWVCDFANKHRDKGVGEKELVLHRFLALDIKLLHQSRATKCSVG